MKKTKRLKDHSHTIFSKSREFKDIRYEAYNDKDNDQDKDKNKDKDKDKDKDNDNDNDNLTIDKDENPELDLIWNQNLSDDSMVLSIGHRNLNLKCW